MIDPGALVTVVSNPDAPSAAPRDEQAADGAGPSTVTYELTIGKGRRMCRSRVDPRARTKRFLPSSIARVPEDLPTFEKRREPLHQVVRLACRELLQSVVRTDEHAPIAEPAHQLLDLPQHVLGGFGDVDQRDRAESAMPVTVCCQMAELTVSTASRAPNTVWL